MTRHQKSEASSPGGVRAGSRDNRHRVVSLPGRRFAHLLQIAVCLSWMGQALAQKQEPEPSLFSIRQHSGYPEPGKSLELLVRTHGTRRTNHFCVIGRRVPGSFEHAWVHWKEGRALILWEPTSDPSYQRRLSGSRRYLDLDRDVVASKEEIGGSNYLVTREWVNQITSQCDAHGDKFVVLKPRRHK